MEGVIKYAQQRIPGKITPIQYPQFEELIKVRKRLYQLAYIGEEDKLAYGNISIRNSAKPDTFLISASQTSGKEKVLFRHFSEVEKIDFGNNKLWWRGVLPPSSEALTHGVIYKSGLKIRTVIHIHNAPLWLFGLKHHHLQVHNEYGTIELANEITRVLGQGSSSSAGIIVMCAHENGLIAYGRNPMEALNLYLSLREKTK